MSTSVVRNKNHFWQHKHVPCFDCPKIISSGKNYASIRFIIPLLWVTALKGVSLSNSNSQCKLFCKFTDPISLCGKSAFIRFR